MRCFTAQAVRPVLGGLANDPHRPGSQACPRAGWPVVLTARAIWLVLGWTGQRLSLLDGLAGSRQNPLHTSAIPQGSRFPRHF